MQQYSSEDELVAGGCGGLIPGRRPGWDLGVLDVRFGCEVCGIRPIISTFLHQLVRSSDMCCQDDGFRLTDVLLCKVFCA